MNEKKVITWDKADQAIIRLALILIERSSEELRTHAEQTSPQPTDGEAPIYPGHADSSRDRIGWWSGELGDPKDYIGTFDDETLPLGLYGIPIVTVSRICWFSFQNMVRLRLRQARREIVENLYGQKRRKYSSKQSSRNSSTRV